MNSTILAETLALFGFASFTAINGRIAVEYFTEFLYKGFLFEMVIMDIIMPEMGGYESTQLIRKAEAQYGLGDKKHFICGYSAAMSAGKAFKVVIMSFIETKKKCEDAGMNTLISKPMHPDVLKGFLDDNKRETNVFKRPATTQPRNLKSNLLKVESRPALNRISQPPSTLLGPPNGISMILAGRESTLVSPMLAPNPHPARAAQGANMPAKPQI
jgi:CheY-like chemotaxis protein